MTAAADFQYTVRPAEAADRRFIVETTARVRQPHGLLWRDWEPFGLCWAEAAFEVPKWDTDHPAWVVVSDGVILGFVLLRGRTVECLYVKKEFRGLGFGQVLLDAAGMDDNVLCRAPTDSWRMWASRRGIRFTVVK